MSVRRNRAPVAPAELSLESVELMACKLVQILPDGPKWLYEIKMDGYRCVGSKSGTQTALFSRQHKDFGETYSAVRAALSSLRCKSAVVDGEIVAMVEGRPSFNALQKAQPSYAEIVCFLFDVLELNGTDCRHKPLIERRRLLGSIMPEKDAILKLSPILPDDPAGLMEGAKRLGFEGIIAKRKDSPYEEGERSGAWVKWKAEQTGIFFIGGYVPGTQGFDELMIGEKEHGALRFVARVKNGFVPATRDAVMKATKGLATVLCPFFNLPEPKAARWGQGLSAEEMEKCRWVKPRVKVEVAFVEWTEGKKLRHSRFLGVSGK